jgi:hypothetical protein
MNEELKYWKVDTIDKLFIPIAYVVSGFFLHELKQVLVNYRNSDFIVTYKEEIVRLQLSNSQIFKQKVINTILDVGPISLFHLSMAMIFLYLWSSCVYAYRNDVKPKSIYQNDFEKEMKCILSYFIDENASIGAKNTVLHRYNQLSPEEKNALSEKIIFELNHASLEKDKEKSMLSSKVFLDILSKEEITIMGNRVDSNHLKTYIYPMLINFLEMASENKMKHLDWKDFIWDILKQLINGKQK